MDPICKEKIQFLQKYVPFLANLIELLANDTEKEGKLAQMQLLFNLLSKPDNSVTIETLEKCEEVLSRVFGTADDKQAESESIETTNSDVPILPESVMPVGKVRSPEEVDLNDAEVICEAVNGCAGDEETKETNEISSNIESTQAAESSEENVSPRESETPEVEDSQADKMEHKTPSVTEEEPIRPHENSIEHEANKNVMSNEPISPVIDPDEEKNEILADPVVITEDSKEDDLEKIKTNDAYLEEKSVLVSITSEATVENFPENPDMNLDPDVDESDTFILPDDGEQLNPLIEEVNSEEPPNVEEIPEDIEEVSEEPNKEPLPEPPSDFIMQNPTEMLPFRIISAESLAVQSLDENEHLINSIQGSKESENCVENSENLSNGNATEGSNQREDLDPLDLLQSPAEDSVDVRNPEPVPEENGSLAVNDQDKEKDDDDNDDDDDDDVLLIETRSSPICIDSDPEDEESTKLSQSLPIIPEKTITENTQKPQQRMSARKSTSVVNTLRHIMKHQNISITKIPNQQKTKKSRDSAFLLKKDPKALMETINLIDSDSDNETNSAGAQTPKANDDDVIIIDSNVPQRMTIPKPIPAVFSYRQNSRYSSRSVIRKQPTAQSNFLNAVNLQPAPKSSSNPATFSAQLSNKKVIIPNAFYGNPSYSHKPQSSSSSSAKAATNHDETSSNDLVSRTGGSSATVSVQQVQDRWLKEWLDGFLTNFASPLQLASHACFVLLQRVLKYRFFQRLKDARVNLNTQAKNLAPGTMDVQMMLDLRNIFLENNKLTDAGRRFCRFATNDAFGKPVALTTDARTGKVTCRTRVGSKADGAKETLKITKPNIPDRGASVSQMSTTANLKTTPPNSNSVLPTLPTLTSNTTARRNRKTRKLSDGTDVPDCDADDNDYTPYMGELILEEQVVSERKKSLRTNRTKRKEAGFTYSEDHDDEEFEALAKKIEDKKREELRAAEERELEKEREKERKVRKTVAKKTTSKRQTNVISTEIEVRKEPVRKKLRLADTEILGTAEDDLLTPTWIEADGDEFDDADADSLLDFAEEPHSPATHFSENDNTVVTDDPVTNGPQDSDDSDSYPPSFDVGTNKLLKNTDRGLHAQSQTFDFCVHCLKRVPRTVHHYVNEHRSSEVFTSRLRTRDIRRLLSTNNVGFVNLYKGNQQQYAAHCIFCDKEAKFLLPYWFEHFTMHTGEYSFKCSGCNIRKPTRSLLTNHLQSGSGCPKRGAIVRLYTFDTKSHQIEAHICTICNYIQVHRKNVVRHLRTQHEIESISENHIIKVVLLQVSGPYRDEEAVRNDEALLSLLQHSDDEENGVNGTVSLDENSLMIQNDFTDNDDLSFMICGMLDVQTNLSATGEILANVDTTNSVDNK